MNYLEEALNIIEENKISTTEVADVIGKTGQVDGVHALNRGLFRVGEVRCIYAINNSNYEVHKQLEEADDLKDKILYVYNVNCDRAIFGDLVSKYVLLYKRAKAIVVNGLLRDAHRLIKEQYPIWLSGVSPIGCVNHINGNPIEPDVLNRIRSIYDGSIMVCDDSGVVMIPKSNINEDLINGLYNIEYQEDLWYYCVDTLKMSTFETVCEKKYLTNGLLDEKVLKRLKESNHIK